MLKTKKLTVGRETLRSLSADQLRRVAGGIPGGSGMGGRCSAQESTCNLSNNFTTCEGFGNLTSACVSINPCGRDTM